VKSVKTYKVEVDLAVKDDRLALLDQEANAGCPEQFLLERPTHSSLEGFGSFPDNPKKRVDNKQTY
jgi:hypothetical protein